MDMPLLVCLCGRPQSPALSGSRPPTVERETLSLVGAINTAHNLAPAAVLERSRLGWQEQHANFAEFQELQRLVDALQYEIYVLRVSSGDSAVRPAAHAPEALPPAGQSRPRSSGGGAAVVWFDVPSRRSGDRRGGRYLETSAGRRGLDQIAHWKTSGPQPKDRLSAGQGRISQPGVSVITGEIDAEQGKRSGCRLP